MPPIRVKSGSCVVKVYPSHATVDGKEYPQFRIVWYENGARRRESRKSEQLAIERADEIARGLARGIAGASLSAEQAASYLRASELLAKLGKPVELAAAEYAQACAILGGLPLLDAAKDYAARNNVRHTPIPDAIKAMVEQKRAEGCSPIYIHDLESRLAKFAAAFSGPVHMITGEKLSRWLAEMKDAEGKELSDRSRTNYRRAVAALIDFAKRSNALPKTFDALDSVGFKVSKPGKATPFSPEEMATVLDVAQKDWPHLVPWIAARAFTGMRYEESRRIMLSDFHLKEKLVVLEARITKTNRQRTVPLHPNLAKWLRGVAGVNEPLSHAANPSTDWGRILTQAGVVYRHNGLRDSYVSYRMAILKDVGRVSQETGHSPAELQKSYRALRLPDGRLITEALARDYFNILPKSGHKSGRTQKSQ